MNKSKDTNQYRIPLFNIYKEKPSQKRIDAINAAAREQGKTYGKLQAEKLLEKQHLEMEARANAARTTAMKKRRDPDGKYSKKATPGNRQEVGDGRHQPGDCRGMRQGVPWKS